MQTKKMGDFRLRNIPEDVHRFLKALAAMSGQSINDYLLDVLKDHVAKKKGKL